MIYTYIYYQQYWIIYIYIYYQIGDQNRGPPIFTIFRIWNSTPRQKILPGRFHICIAFQYAYYSVVPDSVVPDSITVLCLRIPMAWLSCFALTATCKVGLAPCLVLSCLVSCLRLVLSLSVSCYHLYLCLVFFVSCLVLPCLALSCLVISYLVLSRLVLCVTSDVYLSLAGDVDVHKQRTWLQAVLGTSTATFKIVFFHHPPFSSSQHDELADWMVALSF